MYRQGKCADKLSNYLGDTERLRSDSYRYFVRTSASGANIGDTSKLLSHPDDFAYTHDTTCYMEDSNPRKVFLKIPCPHLTSVYIFFQLVKLINHLDHLGIPQLLLLCHQYFQFHFVICYSIMFQRRGKMNRLLIVFLSNFCLSFAFLPVNVRKSDPSNHAEAIGMLSKEILVAMSSFLTNCDKVPIQKPENGSKNTFSITFLNVHIV